MRLRTCALQAKRGKEAAESEPQLPRGVQLRRKSSEHFVGVMVCTVLVVQADGRSHSNPAKITDARYSPVARRQCTWSAALQQAAAVGL
jgi:hypothetical protein